jgi:hypothetical protein
MHFHDAFKHVDLQLHGNHLFLIKEGISIKNLKVICMTEEHYRWEDFKINFGTDIFQRVNFDPPQLRPDPIETETRTPSSFPNFEIPGIKAPEPGFNWQV